MDFLTIIEFWFKPEHQPFWFQKNEKFDLKIIEKFSDVHHSANAGELYEWRNEPLGRLAEVIVLDQFSRNMFRESANSFASDSLALVLAQHAIQAGDDQKLNTIERSFLYMPYMHSESLVIHKEATRLYEQNGIKVNLEFELKHLAIIKRFGRYPHRNKILGRKSSAEEIAFLQQPGASF